MKRVGEKFNYGNIKLKVVAKDGCIGCFFHDDTILCTKVYNTDVACSSGNREDGIPVIFILDNLFKFGK